jgi:hypothetical protein
MLRQEQLAFIKALSTFQLSPAVLKELRMALYRRKKKPLVPAASRSTMPAGGTKVPQRSSSQLAGKRKANELATSGDSFELSNRRPAPTAGSAPLLANTSVTGEQAATSSRQLVPPPQGGATYATALAKPVAPLQPSGSLKPTAMDSEPSTTAVSSETVDRRMSSDMSGLLTDKPDGATTQAQVNNACFAAGERPKRPSVSFKDFVAPVTSWPRFERPAQAV